MIADERRRTLVFTAYLTFWERNFSPVFLVAELFTLAIDNTSGWAAERLLQGGMSTYGRGIAENAILSSFGFSLPFLNNNVQPCPCCASLCLSDIWYRLSLFFFFPSADILDHLSSTSSQPAPRYIVKIKKNSSSPFPARKNLKCALLFSSFTSSSSWLTWGERNIEHSVGKSIRSTLVVAFRRPRELPQANLDLALVIKKRENKRKRERASRRSRQSLKRLLTKFHHVQFTLYKQTRLSYSLGTTKFKRKKKKL